MREIDDRAVLNAPGIVVGVFTLVALVALAPWLFQFASMAAGSTGPFASLLLNLSVPLLFVIFLIGLGGAAAR